MIGGPGKLTRRQIRHSHTEIIDVIAQSIRVSQRGARRVRAHRFKELFGWQVLTTQCREKVEMHFASPLFREGLGYREDQEDQEAAGFSIQSARGSRPGHIEADLLYFADDKNDLDEGEPLVLVECKKLIKDEKDLATPVTQVRSYAPWVVPAYYVITDGRIASVRDFQGANGAAG